MSGQDCSKRLWTTASTVLWAILNKRAVGGAAGSYLRSVVTAVDREISRLTQVSTGESFGTTDRSDKTAALCFAAWSTSP